jgi:hypothetical protein
MLEEVPIPVQQQRPQQEIRKTGQSVQVSICSQFVCKWHVQSSDCGAADHGRTQRSRARKKKSLQNNRTIRNNPYSNKFYAQYEYKNVYHPAAPYQLIASKICLKILAVIAYCSTFFNKAYLEIGS